MDKLVATLRLTLGNTFVMYFKSHSYHWNVEGMLFSEFHTFFGDLYLDLHGAVDPFAEEVRKLDAYAPISLMEIYNYKTFPEDSAKPESVHEMLFNLLEANSQTLESLSNLFDEATKQKQQGLANLAADRMGIHKKHEWIIKSYLKKLGE
jgi:starvation-inducible DNA-binding protein